MDLFCGVVASIIAWLLVRHRQRILFGTVTVLIAIFSVNLKIILKTPKKNFRLYQTTLAEIVYLKMPAGCTGVFFLFLWRSRFQLTSPTC